MSSTSWLFGSPRKNRPDAGSPKSTTGSLGRPPRTRIASAKGDVSNGSVTAESYEIVVGVDPDHGPYRVQPAPFVPSWVELPYLEDFVHNGKRYKRSDDVSVEYELSGKRGKKPRSAFAGVRISDIRQGSGDTLLKVFWHKKFEMDYYISDWLQIVSSQSVRGPVKNPVCTSNRIFCCQKRQKSDKKGIHGHGVVQAQWVLDAIQVPQGAKCLTTTTKSTGLPV